MKKKALVIIISTALVLLTVGSSLFISHIRNKDSHSFAEDKATEPTEQLLADPEPEHTPEKEVERLEIKDFESQADKKTEEKTSGEQNSEITKSEDTPGETAEVKDAKKASENKAELKDEVEKTEEIEIKYGSSVNNEKPPVGKAKQTIPPKETKPENVKDAGTKPAETKAEEPTPEKTEYRETEPVETEPIETKPDVTEPAETEPAETEPAETEPAETEPPKPERHEPKAIDFTVYDEKGNPVKLSDYFGKPIVLNFWASWCGPCKHEMPAFNQKHIEQGSEVQFLMVNLTGYDTLPDAKAVIEENGYVFPVFYDLRTEAAEAYAVQSFPTTYFIDADGYLIAKAVGAISAETLQSGIDMIN